jgi:C-terminal processing protease CtpA/Prc
MRIYVMAAALLALTPLVARAQERNLDSILAFEGASAGAVLREWSGGPTWTVHIDSVIVHGGRGAVRLERDSASSGTNTMLAIGVPVTFEGQWVELHGFIRTEKVSGFAGLWLREDGPTGRVQFDNMRDRGITGTSEWTEYTIRLPLDHRARALSFGVLAVGEGKVWADDLQLLVDGERIRRAPRAHRDSTILDTDQEFADGSEITLSSLSPTQVENVTQFGLVWGFLKYHHPRVAAGEIHWDFELFRVLPRVLAAANRDALHRALVQWVDSLGMPAPCNPCAEPPSDAQLLPDLDWIRDEALLGPALARRLQDIYERRVASDTQFYVSLIRGVANPQFQHELAYPYQHPLDAGYRVLSLVRLWNIIEYWFPYRDQIDGNWKAALREFLPRIVAATSWDAYRLELLAFITRIGDTHANLWSELAVRPPRGRCTWPVAVRVVEGKVTVSAYTDTVSGPASGLEIGDVVEAMDGHPIDSLIASWSPFYSASNPPTRMRDIARSLSRGDCGEAPVTIDRSGRSLTMTVARTRPTSTPARTHDRPGATFQLLSPDVAYLKLSSIHARDLPGYLQQAGGTRGLVIDIRNYPSEFVVFALGSHLVDAPTPFARFTKGNLHNPGAFTWRGGAPLQPQPPIYTGKVAILVDEVSQSQAEYTTMALRAGPRAVVVGSTTAGADGNVSSIPLPGGIATMMSGIGVFYPNGTPTQRVGIVPDVVVTPTIEGIREGRDEVLEVALRQILGPDADEQTIRQMARRPQ